MHIHVSLDSNHRISIPLHIRKQLALKKGDSLVMTLVNNEIHLNSIDTKISEAQKLVQQYCGKVNLVDELFTTRKEELEKEQDRQAKYNSENENDK